MPTEKDGKKQRKPTRDSEFKRRSSLTSPRPESSSTQGPSSSNPGASSRPPPSHGSASYDYVQRRTHWETVLDPSSPPYHRSDRSTPFSTSHSSHPPLSSSQSGPSHRGGHSSQSSRSSSRAVPIAPNGPLVNPLEEDDGCRFECQEEGCQQKFRHRSSRSRHKRLSHPRSLSKGSHANR